MTLDHKNFIEQKQGDEIYALAKNRHFGNICLLLPIIAGMKSP